MLPYLTIPGLSIFASTEHLRMLFVLSALNLEQVIQALTQYVQDTRSKVDLILVGGLALQAYGLTDRTIVDLDGELVGELNPHMVYLKKRPVPPDLGESTSWWSVVAMPLGYRNGTKEGDNFKKLGCSLVGSQ